MHLIAILIHHWIRVRVRQCLQAQVAIVQSCPVTWRLLIETLNDISMIVHEHRRQWWQLRQWLPVPRCLRMGMCSYLWMWMWIRLGSPPFSSNLLWLNLY